MSDNNLIDHKFIRNVAIIAHVDHGKTTLYDAIIKQTNLRDNQVLTERFMDSGSIEKERGITILAKYNSIDWGNHRFNIIDTPGHSDFGGEVEGIMQMVDGVVLLVDSAEGVMPQTKFVLGKAINKGIIPIVLVNKMDRPDSRYQEVINEISDLILSFDIDEKFLNFPLLYGVGKAGWVNDVPTPNDNIFKLLETIIDHVPSPKIMECAEGNGGFLVSMLGQDEFLGKTFTGKVYGGTLKKNSPVKIMKKNGTIVENKYKILQINRNLGIKNITVDEVGAGDIAVLIGPTEATINDTICTKDWNDQIDSIDIEPPTISITISANTLPLKGKEGKKVNYRDIRDYLFKEAEYNQAIKVEEDVARQELVVSGRGELQLGVLLENLRRADFEVVVGHPKALFKVENGETLEPLEQVTVEVDEEYAGAVIEKITGRKGIMINMIDYANKQRLIFEVPSRCLFGYRQEFLSDTRGTGIMNRAFLRYDKYRGDFGGRKCGVLIADRAGQATGYAIFNLLDRGSFFIPVGTEVYEGMIIGESSTTHHVWANVTKTKQLSNMRSAGKDDNIIIPNPRQFTIETALGFINEGEVLEITPKSIRIAKINIKR
jgi:GTP-binding protein